MENARGKEWNSTEKSWEEYGNPKSKRVSVETEEEHWTSSQPGTSALPRTSAKETKQKKSVNGDNASCLKEKAQCNENLKPRKKIPIPPLPSQLPPINLLHRDVVRAWCGQLKLSTKGQKLEVYKRLCEYAYPNQKNIPTTAKEARMQGKSKRNMGEMFLESSEKRTYSEETDPPEMAPPPGEGLSTLGESAALLEGINPVVVTTTAPEAVLASWARVAARAGKMDAVESEVVETPPETEGVRWCVVHGRSLPASTNGWVRLQFHAGQVWVPEKKTGRVSALFLLPACNFPPPHMEDNMLCPTCVHRNKVLIKSLQ
ncbi:PREDICTED: developmental pluripotency-associated protein 4 [Galeopterus variegatus]|uniref:Developmental pluripotency-associated protein 4 n=1 Tax=Galeopterus variegatus TaxID=482537 RepID=A0ABM0SH63_GALVR|nr:PREDICTED: developmental pluripotency-associated protein 4 [Galeopterus variegatus]